MVDDTKMAEKASKIRMNSVRSKVEFFRGEFRGQRAAARGACRAKVHSNNSYCFYIEKNKDSEKKCVVVFLTLKKKINEKS